MRFPLVMLLVMVCFSAHARKNTCLAYSPPSYSHDHYLGPDLGIKYYGSMYYSVGLSYIHESYEPCAFGYSTRGIYLEFADDLNSKTNSIHAGIWYSNVVALGIEVNSVYTKSHVNFGVQPLAGIAFGPLQAMAGYNIQPVVSDFNPANQWTFLLRFHCPLFLLHPRRESVRVRF